MKPISTRKRYNDDFKIEAVKLIESEGYSLGEGSIRLGISKSTLSKWKGLYSHNSSIDNISAKNQKNGLSIFEQKQLEKELARVKKERDILKKALAYFAAEPQ
jgi:transposase